MKTIFTIFVTGCELYGVQIRECLASQFNSLGLEVVYCLLTYSKRKVTSWNKDQFFLSTVDFVEQQCEL